MIFYQNVCYQVQGQGCYEIYVMISPHPTIHSTFYTSYTIFIKILINSYHYTIISPQLLQNLIYLPYFLHLRERQSPPPHLTLLHN